MDGSPRDDILGSPRDDILGSPRDAIFARDDLHQFVSHFKSLTVYDMFRLLTKAVKCRAFRIAGYIYFLASKGYNRNETYTIWERSHDPEVISFLLRTECQRVYHDQNIAKCWPEIAISYALTKGIPLGEDGMDRWHSVRRAFLLLTCGALPTSSTEMTENPIFQYENVELFANLQLEPTTIGYYSSLEHPIPLELSHYLARYDNLDLNSIDNLFLGEVDLRYLAYPSLRPLFNWRLSKPIAIEYRLHLLGAALQHEDQILYLIQEGLLDPLVPVLTTEDRDRLWFVALKLHQVSPQDGKCILSFLRTHQILPSVEYHQRIAEAMGKTK
jgi:hypothetical protein